MIEINQPKYNFSGNLLVLSLFILPLFINSYPSMNYNDVFVVPKATWLLGVILPSALFVLWTYRSGVSRWLWWLTGFWLLWCLLGFLFGVNHSFFWNGVPGRQSGFPVYLCYAATMLGVCGWVRLNPRALAQILQLTWLILPLGIYVALQYYGFAGIPGGTDKDGISATLMGATLGNRGYLAGLVALLLPLSFAYTGKSIWSFVFIFLAGFMLAVTLERGAILGALAGYIYWMGMGKNWKRLSVNFALFLGVLVSFLQISPQQTGARSMSNVGDLSQSSGRTVLWNSAVKGIEERPLFGWGQGQLINIMASRPDALLLKENSIDTIHQNVVRIPRISDETLRWRISKEGSKSKIFSNSIIVSHNEFLDYALSFGIPAALIVFSLLAIAIWRGRCIPWAGAATLGYAIYLLTWPETIRFAPIAWAILGVALAGNPRVLTTTQGVTVPSTAVPLK